jgi:hypothetical protein
MNRPIRFILFSTVLAISGLSALAQDAKINISQLDHLEPRAANVINVNVDEKLLQIAAKFLSSNKPDEAAVKALVMGLKGVYVKSFEFDKENEFTPADIQAIRSQLNDPRWTRMVDIHSKREGETVEVHTMLDGTSKMEGMVVLVVDPKEITVVNIVGPVDLDKLAELSGKFGIPNLNIERHTPKKLERRAPEKKEQ